MKIWRYIAALAASVFRLRERRDESPPLTEKQTAREVVNPSPEPEQAIPAASQTPPPKPQCPKCGKGMTVFRDGKDALCIPCEEAFLARARAKNPVPNVVRDKEGNSAPEHVIGYEGAVMRSPGPEPLPDRYSDSGWDLTPSRRTPARW